MHLYHKGKEQRRATDTGCQLNGPIATILSQDVNYLKEVAVLALIALAELEEGARMVE